MNVFNSGLKKIAYGIGNLDNWVTGSDPDSLSASQYASSMIRNDVIRDDGTGGGWGIAYDLTSTTANMLPSILVSYILVVGQAAGLVSMGAAATGNAYAEMKRLGYDDWQARGYSLAVGVSEAVLEKVLGGIGKLTGGSSKGAFQAIAGKILPKIDNALARIAIDLGSNMLDEGVEEALQSVLEPLFAAAFTKGEAFEGIDLEEVIYSGLLGMLSAGVLEGLPTVIGNVEASRVYRQARELYGNGVEGALVAEALALNPDSRLARKLKARLDKGHEVSGAELYSLVQENRAAIEKVESGEAPETAAEAVTEEVRADEATAPETAVEENHGAQEAVSEATPAEYVADGLTVEQAAPRFRAMGAAGMSASDAVAEAKESGILWKDRAISDEAMSILMDAWTEGAAVYVEKQKPEAAEANVQDSTKDARNSSEKAENEAAKKENPSMDVYESMRRDLYRRGLFEGDGYVFRVSYAAGKHHGAIHRSRAGEYSRKSSDTVYATSAQDTHEGAADELVEYAKRKKLLGKITNPVVQPAENRGDDAEKGGKDTGKSQIGGTMIENSPVYKTADTLMDAVGRLTPVDYTRRRELAQEKYHISDDECMALQMYVRGSAYEWGRLQREADLSTWDEYDRMLIDLAQSAFEKHSVFAGRTYRNLQFGRPDEAPSAYEAFLAEHSPGATVTWKAFSSASKDPNGYVVSGDKIIHLVLDGVRARDISETFGYPEQQEVVYLPGTRLIVTEIGVANDGHPIIYAKEIDENGNDLGRNHESEGDRQDRRREGNAGGKGNDSGGIFGIGGREEGSDRGRTGEIHEASHIHGGEQNGREEITQTAGKDSPKEESDMDGLRARKKPAAQDPVPKQKITAGMSEAERIEILKKSEIVLVPYEGPSVIDESEVERLKHSCKSQAESILLELGEKFGSFRKDYANASIDLEFEYSHASLHESVFLQNRTRTDFSDFAKMMYLMNNLVASAVPVEVHTDKYVGTTREDRNLEHDYVLVSAFVDDGFIIPVEFNIKRFFATSKLNNKMHVSITLGKIKIEDSVLAEFNEHAYDAQKRSARLSSVISIPQLVASVNSKYGDFFRYIPDQFLSEEQIESKRTAEEIERVKIEKLRQKRIEQEERQKRESNKKRSSITDRDESEWTPTEIPDGEPTVERSNAEPASASELTALIQERFGVHITIGHLRTRGTEGEYDTKTGGMRIKLANDLPTIAHELGHHLEREFGLEDFERENKAVLEAVLAPAVRDAYKEELRASEGFAEFLRRYLLDRGGAELELGRDAEGKVSKDSLFYRFEAAMDDKTLADLQEVSDVIYALNHDLSVASSKAVRRQRAMEEQFFTFLSSSVRALRDREYRGELLSGAKDTVKARITEETRLTFHRDFSATDVGKSWYSRFMTSWVDRNYLLYEIARAGNGKADAYVYAQNAHYAGSVAFANAVGDKLCDIDGNVVGESLGAILKPLYTQEHKGKRLISKMDYDKYDAFNEYLVVRHAPERMAEGMKIFGNPRLDTPAYCEARQAELEAQYPEFSDMAERLYEFQKNLLKAWAVKTGIISAAQAEEWGKRWQFYVPLQRVMDDKIQTGGKGAKKSYANQKSPWHRAVGSTRDIIAPVDSIITTMTNLVSISHRNKVMLALTASLKSMPDSSFLMEKIPAHIKRETVDTTAAKDMMLEDMMENGMDGELSMSIMELVNKYFDDTMERFTRKAKPGEPDEITVLRNGKAELWQVNNRELFEVVAGLQGETRNAVLKLVEKLTRFQVGALTGNNLAWSLRSNIFRDFQTAATYLTGDVDLTEKGAAKEVARRWLSLMEGYAKSFMASFKDTYGQGSNDVTWREMMAQGGGDASLWASDKKASVRIQREIEKSVLAKLSPFRFISCVSEAIEKGPRYAAYKLYRQSGADPAYAFYRAMDLTVNFKRGGTISKDVTKWVPFFNASIQGIDRMVRYFTGQQIDENLEIVHGKARKKLVIQRATLALAAAVIGAALAQLLRQMDKEDYDRLSTYTKNNYWCIPLPSTHKFVTIPKPRELTVLESGLERTLDRTLGDGHAYDEFGEYALGTLAPPIVSDILQIPSDGLEEATFSALGSIGIIGPAVEIYANKNFLGQPIIPSYLEDVLPADQYKQSTSVLAYWLGNTALGRGLGLSPVGIDHFGESVLGGYWELHKSLLPLNGDYRDVTVGFGGSLVRNSAYSTDVSNRLYDGREAAMLAYNSDPEDMEKKIAYKWYDTTATFYSRYGKLAKETKDGEQAEDDRLRALEHVGSFLSVMESGGKVDGQAELEAYVAATGDVSVMPGVMQTFIKYGEDGSLDQVLELDAADYVEFQGKYNTLYWKYASAALSGKLTEAQRGEALQAAKDQALIEAKNYMLSLHGYMGKRYKQTTGYDGVKSAGVSLTDYAKVKQFWSEAEADKDRNGKTVSGSKRDKVAAYIHSLRLPDTKKDALYLAMGYSESTLEDAPWH